MPNPNPFQARIAKKRTRKPGKLLDLQRLLWRALLTAEEILDGAEGTADDPPAWVTQLRAIHALSQAAGQYAKLLEIGELEARISALEAAHKETQR